MRRFLEICRVPLLLLAAVCAVYWKILSGQYSVLENPDVANMDLPWLDLQVHALRSGVVALWTPYEWFGHTLIGQFSFAIGSPFSYLLALTPLDAHGHLQFWFIDRWIVLIHCAAAMFAYWLLRDLKCSRAAAAAGGLLYATAGGIGNTGWPQFLVAAIWGPLVFLFFFRSLRGRAPFKSAAWAGVMLGIVWLGGHHSPAIYLTLAIFGTGFVLLSRRPGEWITGGYRLGVTLVVFVLIGSFQALPVFESGRLSLRWISTGSTGWKDKVPLTEHGLFSLSPPDILHFFIPGGAGLYWDPFIGVVGLSLSAIAIVCLFRRVEVKIFAALAIGSVLFAMAKNDVFYGLFYALVPLVEKAREPLVMLSVFDIAIAGLAGFGMDELLAGRAAHLLPRIAKILAAFAGAVLLLFVFAAFLLPTVTSYIAQGDNRVGMVALVAIGTAGLLLAWNRGLVSRRSLVLMLCAGLMIEQGVESDWRYAHKDDKGRAKFLEPLLDTQDVADFLSSRPGPKRVEVKSSDVPFNFGNWYRIDAPEEYSNGLPSDTARLGWDSDRLSRMYGENFSIARTYTRAGQQDLFTGKSGIKVFANPAAFPRAWTVHDVMTAPDEDRAAKLVSDGMFDLRSLAVMAGKSPSLNKCAGQDRVTAFQENLLSVRVGAAMACTGLLIVSDSYYPGWRADVDGKAATLWKVNTVIRGVVVPPGQHEVVMRYQPLSVYAGLVLALLGLAIAFVLQRRPEQDGKDLLAYELSTGGLHRAAPPSTERIEARSP